jgi:hypothetical protein
MTDMPCSSATYAVRTDGARPIALADIHVTVGDEAFDCLRSDSSAKPPPLLQKPAAAPARVVRIRGSALRSAGVYHPKRRLL